MTPWLLLLATLSPAQSDTLPPDLGTRKAGVDWPGFLGPFGTSVSPEKGILTRWPAEGLRVLWQLPVGQGYSMPAISRGRLFQFHRIGDKARLSCVESETGKGLWFFEYPTDYEDFYGYSNGPRCSPVVDGERVYIHGVEGMLHCLKVTDGSLLWKVDTKATFNIVQNFFGVGSTPVIEGDLLLVQIGGATVAPAQLTLQAFSELKSNGTGLVAFDKRTGTVRYKSGNELASYASPVLATIGERRWCFLFARGGLLGLDPTTGKVDFHHPWRAKVIESANAANPVVVGDRVLISETYGPGSCLLRVKPGSAEVIWSDAEKGRDKSLQCHWNTPIHVDGFVYGCTGRYPQGADLRCLELATGKVQWQERGTSLLSLMQVDGHFLSWSQEGELRLIKVNPTRYEEIARLDLGSRAGKPFLEYPCWAAPILSHGLLYLRGKDRLACFELIPATVR